MEKFCHFCRKPGHSTAECPTNRLGEKSSRQVVIEQLKQNGNIRIVETTNPPSKSETPSAVTLWKRKNVEKVRAYQREYMRKKRHVSPQP